MKGVVVKVSLWNRRSGNAQLSLAKTNAAAKAKRDGNTFVADAVGAGFVGSEASVGAADVEFTAGALALGAMAEADADALAGTTGLLCASPPWKIAMPITTATRTTRYFIFLVVILNPNERN